MSGLDGMKRTAYCAEFSEADAGREVTVMGWVDSYRNLGSIIFVYLRDRTGTVQLAFDESEFAGFSDAERLRNEFVIAATGVIVKRADKDINANITTGAIEIKVNKLVILSKSETPPFEIWDNTNVREDLRLQYRYLDLRRSSLQNNLIMRHKIAKVARDYFSDNGFIEIETPMLGKSTPEGARDYLVPSRIHPGAFYALPQSPQLFKQLLMISGFDRYMQIAKCFRDEDLRADRQPEFTQIDLEMSFVDVDDVIAVNEGFLKHLFGKLMNIELKTPFPRLTYKVAMERYGSDKPDTRFGLELKNISDIMCGCGFSAFADVVASGGSVRAVVVPGGVSHYSRKEIDALQEYVKTYGAKGLAWMSMKEEGPQSSIMKFFEPERWEKLLSSLNAVTGDLVFIVAGKDKVVFDSLGHLRLSVAEKLKLIPENSFDFLWVVDFPQFEYSEEEGRYMAMHHPFTCPKDECLDYIESDPGAVLAKAYDCVLNGNELGGGSIRIHTTELQERMLKALGFTEQRAWESFGFLLDALKFGAPPHGGLAFGLDRMAMLLCGTDAIRDVIAFPKVQNASDLMSGAPGSVEEKQLRELELEIKK